MSHTARGLAYIAGQQNPDGSFYSFSSLLKRGFRPAHTYQTTFVPALILSALAGIDDKPALAVRRRAAAWLMTQKSPQSSFNYWARQSPEAEAMPYPDDLDDTFCALGALAQHNPKLIDARMLASIVKLLIATETKPGGPYRTWLTTAKQKVWRDTDLAVNANIACFLSVASEPLPGLVAWLDGKLASQLSSPYYPSDIPLLYYICRQYNGQQHQLLITRLRQRLRGRRTALEQALLISSLARLGADVPKESLERLRQAQQADGSWPAAAFCLDPARDGHTFYDGCAALTTAFVLEALSLQTTAKSPATRARAIDPAPILRMAQQTCSDLAPDLLRQTMDYIGRVARGSSGQEIIGLPWLFNASLEKPLKNETLLPELATGNVLGWTAYTIYDDFMDEEGQPVLLPAANACHRRSLGIFETAVGDVAFVRGVFDAIDGANAWELAHARAAVRDNKIQVPALPDFGKRQRLAERSLGHLLSPIAILKHLGHPPADVASRQVQAALKHYLIARQLHDDTHDWQDDLAHGQLTFVATLVLQTAGVGSGSRDLEKLMPRLQRQFWHHTLNEVCAIMQQHLRLSRRGLERSGLFKADAPLYILVDRLEASVSETLAVQVTTKEFLRHYKGRPTTKSARAAGK